MQEEVQARGVLSRACMRGKANREVPEADILRLPFSTCPHPLLKYTRGCHCEQFAACLPDRPVRRNPEKSPDIAMSMDARSANCFTDARHEAVARVFNNGAGCLIPSYSPSQAPQELASIPPWVMASSMGLVPRHVGLTSLVL
jgi:hypothetical protein